MSPSTLAEKLMVSSTFSAAATQLLAIPPITVVLSAATSEAYLEIDEGPSLQWNAEFLGRCSHFELCAITAHAIARWHEQLRDPSAPVAARETCADYVCGWLCARFAAGPMPHQLEALQALLDAIPGPPYHGGRGRTRRFVQGWCDQVDPTPSLHLLER